MTTHEIVGPAATTAGTVLLRAVDGSLVLEPRRRCGDLVTRLLASWLDPRIARGDAPETGRFLAVRAAQLVEPAGRREVAEGWELVLARASRPRRGVIEPQVPVARDAVLAARSEILELVAVLRSGASVSARDVARARLLLTDGAGPVYRGGGDLRREVAGLVTLTF